MCWHTLIATLHIHNNWLRLLLVTNLANSYTGKSESVMAARRIKISQTRDASRSDARRKLILRQLRACNKHMLGECSTISCVTAFLQNHCPTSQKAGQILGLPSIDGLAVLAGGSPTVLDHTRDPIGPARLPYCSACGRYQLDRLCNCHATRVQQSTNGKRATRVQHSTNG